MTRLKKLGLIALAVVLSPILFSHYVRVLTERVALRIWSDRNPALTIGHFAGYVTGPGSMVILMSFYLWLIMTVVIHCTGIEEPTGALPGRLPTTMPAP